MSRPFAKPSLVRSLPIAAIAILGAALAVSAAEVARPTDRLELSVDGMSLGSPRSVSGGGLRAEVAESVGVNDVEKHVTGVSYEPIALEFGMAISPALQEWIDESWEKRFERRSGSLVISDQDDRTASGLEFYDAHISEVTLPTLDAASEEPGLLGVKIQAEEVRSTDARRAPSLAVVDEPTEKKWLCSNFRMEIDGMPDAGVLRIDAFSMRRNAEGDLEVPNLRISISAANAGPWLDWYRSFVIDGRNADSDELDGTITFLGPDHVEELGRIDLRHMGIVALTPVEHESSAAEPGPVAAEIYVEEMKLSFGAVEASG